MNRLLSWPGAKYRQMDSLLSALGTQDFRIIVEPFLGTGAFTWTVGGGEQRCFAAEADLHLYWWWKWMIEQPEEMVLMMAEWRDGYDGAAEDREVFDRLRDGYNRLYATSPEALETAALLWVLVYQSTNNLARFNSDGEYNQTWGKGRKVPDPFVIFGEEEKAALRWFGSSLVNGLQQDFRECVDSFIAYGDKDRAIVYFDPPYIVRTETYQRGAWTLEQETDLLAAARSLDALGVPWAWTTYLEKGGVTHPLMKELEGWRVVPLARKMDARPKGKGTPSEEVIILGSAVKGGE